MLDHAFPFLLTIIFYHRFLFILTLQVHAHTNSISLRMKLCADKIIIKPNAHDGSFIRHMKSFFFNGENVCTKFFNAVMIWFYNLVIAAVNSIKWIMQIFKNNFIKAVMHQVYREDAE